MKWGQPGRPHLTPTNFPPWCKYSAPRWQSYVREGALAPLALRSLEVDVPPRITCPKTPRVIGVGAEPEVSTDHLRFKSPVGQIGVTLLSTITLTPPIFDCSVKLEDKAIQTENDKSVCITWNCHFIIYIIYRDLNTLHEATRISFHNLCRICIKLFIFEVSQPFVRAINFMD